ncbi:unnamed protein product [Phytophthora fragariaefolia]|uniref:Unnamed protein product n=1 Tax=Phytophthora fragariaefolia TaxID=1490495 RepID=A0A9W6Y8T5_9STRA|nr:unnamed protein product [Phytophthora fragariaefolia]
MTRTIKGLMNVSVVTMVPPPHARIYKHQQLLCELLGVISTCALNEEEEGSSALDKSDMEHVFDTDMDDSVALYTLVARHQ